MSKIPISTCPVCGGGILVEETSYHRKDGKLVHSMCTEHGRRAHLPPKQGEKESDTRQGKLF